MPIEPNLCQLQRENREVASVGFIVEVDGGQVCMTPNTASSRYRASRGMRQHKPDPGPSVYDRAPERRRPRHGTTQQAPSVSDEAIEPAIAPRAGWRWAVAIGAAIALLLTVYVPAFAVTKGLRLPIDQVVPAVMAITVVIASACALGLIRFAQFGTAEFGLRGCRPAHAAVALATAAPLAFAVAWLLRGVHEPGPLQGLTLSPATLWLYFAVFAPLQEEWIFRGLLQTAATHVLGRGPASRPRAGVGGMAIAALLFAAVHLAVGPWTATAALLLALIAGEARRRSNSLLPAVLVHSLFNVGALVLALR